MKEKRLRILTSFINLDNFAKVSNGQTLESGSNNKEKIVGKETLYQTPYDTNVNEEQGSIK